MIFITIIRKKLGKSNRSFEENLKNQWTTIVSVLQIIFGMFASVEMSFPSLASLSVHEKLYSIRRFRTDESSEEELGSLEGIIAVESEITLPWRSHEMSILKFADSDLKDSEILKQVKFPFHYNRLKAISGKLLEGMNLHSFHVDVPEEKQFDEKNSCSVLKILKMLRLLPVGISSLSITAHSLHSLLSAYNEKSKASLSQSRSLCSGSFTALTSFAVNLIETPQPQLHSVGLMLLFLGLSLTTSSNILANSSFAIPKLLNRVGVFSSSMSKFVALRCIDSFLVASTPASLARVNQDSPGAKSLLANSSLHLSHSYFQEINLLILRSREPQDQFFLVHGIKSYVSFTPHGV